MKALSKIDGLDFEILSCEKLFLIEGKNLLISPIYLKRLLEPLFSDKFDKPFVKRLETDVKKAGMRLFNMPGEHLAELDFTNSKTAYKVFFHQMEDLIFTFLMRQLSAAEMREIKQNTKAEIPLGSLFKKLFERESGGPPFPFAKGKKHRVH